MLIIYTGEGKGKTSASVGQALRALGQGLRVCFAQFIKTEKQAGEQILLRRLLGENFLAGGLGFYFREEEKARHAEAARHVLAWATERAGTCDLLVLDEALYALDTVLIQEEELRGIMNLCRDRDIHLVLTGRGLPEWIHREADLVTKMILVKHPYDTGQKAQAGIEY